MHIHTQTADIIATELDRRVEVVKDPRLRERVGYCELACVWPSSYPPSSSSRGLEKWRDDQLQSWCKLRGTIKCL